MIRKGQCVCLAFLASLTLGKALAADAQAPTSTPMLKARIVHSEKLPPMTVPGKINEFYRAQSLPIKAKPDRVFKVPDWLVGVWIRQNMSETSRVELPSGKKLTPVGVQMAFMRDQFGTYRDARGQVWQRFSFSKARGQTDRGTVLDMWQVKDYDLEITSPDTVVIRAHTTHTFVSKKSHRIEQSFQDEELNTYTRTTNKKAIKTDSSVKTFDVKGNPTLLTQSSSGETFEQALKL